MAKYTIELRTLLENSNVDLTLTNYPLYTFKNINQNNNDFGKDLKGNQITNYRDYLNNKIYKHYYFREIGFETPQLFVFMLNRKLEEIMLYYNQMYESTDLKFNPLWNVEMHETFTHEVSDNGNTNSKSTENGSLEGTTIENGSSERFETLEQKSVNDIDGTGTKNSTRTPNITKDNISAEMNTAQNLMTVEQIRQHDFLSKAVHNLELEAGAETESENITNETKESLNTTNDNTINNTNDSTVNTNQTNSNINDTAITNINKRIENYTKLTEGSSPGLPYSYAIKQWRNILVNIDMLIIEELEELFMQIF